jgi:hypothetical protein
MKRVFIKGDSDGMIPFSRCVAMSVSGKELLHLVPCEPWETTALCGVRCYQKTQTEYIGTGRFFCGACLQQQGE